MKFSIFNLIAFSRFRYSFALFISTSAIPNGLASIAYAFVAYLWAGRFL